MLYWRTITESAIKVPLNIFLYLQIHLFCGIVWHQIFCKCYKIPVEGCKKLRVVKSKNIFTFVWIPTEINLLILFIFFKDKSYFLKNFVKFEMFSGTKELIKSEDLFWWWSVSFWLFRCLCSLNVLIVAYDDTWRWSGSWPRSGHRDDIGILSRASHFC